MILFKGNRITTPAFNKPLLQFDKKQMVKNERLPIAYYLRYHTAITLYECTKRAGAKSFTFRGVWVDGKLYPLTVEVSDVWCGTLINTRLFFFKPTLPDFFQTEQVKYIDLVNHMTGRDDPLFPYNEKFASWYKLNVTAKKWKCTPTERRDMDTAYRLWATVETTPISKELMGLDLFYWERLRWLGALAIPLWSDSDEYHDEFIIQTKFLTEQHK